METNHLLLPRCDSCCRQRAWATQLQRHACNLAPMPCKRLYCYKICLGQKLDKSLPSSDGNDNRKVDWSIVIRNEIVMNIKKCNFKTVTPNSKTETIVSQKDFDALIL